MTTVAFNGNPNKEGNTWHALKMVAAELEREGIETEIIHVGNKLIRGCRGRQESSDETSDRFQ
jgi:multimeric flavodoxin WrbA